MKMVNACQLCRNFWRTMTMFETNSVIQYSTNSTPMNILGVIYRIIQVLIIVGIFIYIFLFEKSYQRYSGINSSMTIKLKGSAVTNFSEDVFKVDNPDIYRRIWDVQASGSMDNGAFFVMTNVIITPNQTRNQVCAEDPRILGAICNSTRNTCVQGKFIPNGNGVMTGRCVPSNYPKIHTCEVIAWCPVETDTLPLGPHRALLNESKIFTVFLKNHIEFYEFGITRSNVKNTADENYLKSCRYNRKTDPWCPIFKLDDIVTEAGENYDEISIKGGIISIVITWDCDHLRMHLKRCIPTYRFRRLDNHNAIGSGCNFRYATYYSDTVRTVYKAYGIRFVVFVDGKGGKFAIAPFVLSFGSYLGLMGLAAITCDLVLKYMFRKCKSLQVYSEKKFTRITSETDECVITVTTKV